MTILNQNNGEPYGIYTDFSIYTSQILLLLVWSMSFATLLAFTGFLVIQLQQIDKNDENAIEKKRKREETAKLKAQKKQEPK